MATSSPGSAYGATDDFRYNILENPVHVRDLSATILHRLDIDHHRLTVKQQGLDLWRPGACASADPNLKAIVEVE